MSGIRKSDPMLFTSSPDANIRKLAIERLANLCSRPTFPIRDGGARFDIPVVEYLQHVDHCDISAIVVAAESIATLLAREVGRAEGCAFYRFRTSVFHELVREFEDNLTGWFVRDADHSSLDLLAKQPSDLAVDAQIAGKIDIGHAESRRKSNEARQGDVKVRGLVAKRVRHSGSSSSQKRGAR